MVDDGPGVEQAACPGAHIGADKGKRQHHAARARAAERLTSAAGWMNTGSL